MSLESMRNRWTAFGWDAWEMKGDEMEGVVPDFRSIDYTNKKPHLLILPILQRKRSVLYWKALQNGIMACLQPNNMKRLFARYPKKLKN